MVLNVKKADGFTLVEILIVLLILSVLTAIVALSITGIFGRGSAQAFTTDEEIIQNSVVLFYYDTHKYDSNDGWNEATGHSDHYLPTING